MKQIEGFTKRDITLGFYIIGHFRVSAIHRKGTYEQRLTLYHNHTFMSVEPFDFTKTMKMYMPLCPILTIPKTEKRLLNQIYQALPEEQKAVYDKNKSKHKGLIFFTCFAIYEKDARLNTIDKSFINISSSRAYINFTTGERNILPLNLTDDKETFKSFIDSHTTVYKKEVDTKSERYQKLLRLVNGNEELARKMYGE